MLTQSIKLNMTFFKDVCSADTLEKGVIAAMTPLLVVLLIQRLVFRHSFEICFQIAVEHKIGIANRVIVDKIVKL